MIQTKSNISTPDGLTFTNPLFSLNVGMPSKFQPVQVNLLIGTIKEGLNPDETTTNYFKSIYDFGTFTFNVVDPSFSELQNLALAKLQEIYPLATFEIV